MSTGDPLPLYAAALSRLFPVTQPETAVWTETQPIQRVLAELATCGAAWTATPDGREALLRSVAPGVEAPHLLEIATDRARYLVQPERLVLETFEGHLLTYLRLSVLPLGLVEVGERMSLAEHNRVRVNGGAFVWFCSSSPLRRAAVDRGYAAWDPERLKGFVFSLQETMLAETGGG